MITKIKKNDIYEILLIENMLINDKWSHIMFENEIVNNKSFCLKYLLKNKILGYIIFHYIFDEIIILKFAIHPLYQRKKIGSLLINYIKYNILNDNEKIYLEVRFNNKNAINFYKKNNFNKIYIRKNYYNNPKDNAIVMCFIRKDIYR